MDYFKRARQFRAKKRLGQNFLVDSKIIQRILNEANLSKDETVLEIGAGLGFVTEELAKIADRVIAIEIDTDAIKELSSLPYSNIEIVNQDILKADLSELVDKPVKIIANIPYYITSPILVHLLGEIDQYDYKNRKYISEIILMVQYEVAKRIVANEKSSSKEYGLLSILVNYWAETELICKVQANSFYPAPKVDSALLKLKVRQEPIINISNPKLFRRVIQAAFGQRRKNIKNALTNAGFDSNIVIAALLKSHIEPNRRGETLSIEEYKDLTESMASFLGI
ncbi:MAG: ribosomal RNA small subunit methyltransferase A [Candidatus Melainabacteria bacterium RIFOXYA12_FULL_32_12]|nr:MAG: ribosomal RNA small subunit methyltransferase A [Candidatus Melainabacteria bacterium GWF2_32_7]OGI22991.1 MAG: ribosomal RNA small subunit methyltransferase A [Candidatus Melainabacteria bacterium RIFOXYA2_FULL_32_9]OGI31544.1 MAG: ribosomal RNA small subunit methyltransferase A [Candidatus Melainabacteria bacterium RIFOXYA12_FULL_32_12]